MQRFANFPKDTQNSQNKQMQQKHWLISSDYLQYRYIVPLTLSVNAKRTYMAHRIHNRQRQRRSHTQRQRQWTLWMILSSFVHFVAMIKCDSATLSRIRCILHEDRSVWVFSFASPCEWFTSAIIWWMFSFLSRSEHWLSKPITTSRLNHVNHTRKKKNFHIAICGNKLFDYHFENCFQHEHNKQQQNIELWVQFELESKRNRIGIVHSLNESSKQQLLHIKPWFSCEMHNFNSNPFHFVLLQISQIKSRTMVPHRV